MCSLEKTSHYITHYFYSLYFFTLILCAYCIFIVIVFINTNMSLSVFNFLYFSSSFNFLINSPYCQFISSSEVLENSWLGMSGWQRKLRNYKSEKTKLPKERKLECSQRSQWTAEVAIHKFAVNNLFEKCNCESLKYLTYFFILHMQKGLGKCAECCLRAHGRSILW